MGSLHWGQSSGQPWSSAGSLWGWAASRLRLDWTTRFFQEDEEMLALTQRDELNRTYSEDNRLPLNNPATKRGPSCDETRTTRTSSGENSLVRIQREELNRSHPEDSRLPTNDTRTEEKQSPNEPRSSSGEDSLALTQRDDLNSTTVKDRPAPNLMGSTRPGFKETRATITSTGPRTSTVSTQNKGRSYRLAGQCGGNVQNQRLAGLGESFLEPLHSQGSKEGEDGGEKQDRQEGVEGSSHYSTSLEEEGARLGLANRGVQSSSLNPTPTITAWEAGWNVTNAIQGIFVLGLPYALVQSGYLGLVLLVLSAWVCNHTGRILVACLYEEEHSGGSGWVRVRHSYQDVAEACCKGLWPHWAGLGGWMVNVAQVIELVMTCTLYLVVSTSLLSDSLSGMAVPRSVCSLVSLMFLLPCLLLTDLRPVSTLSLLCSLAHILISLLVILYCVSRARSWSWSCLSLSVEPEDFLVSVGVIIFSYTSQIFLPPLEGSMEDRGQFSAMLGWTHAAACIMKTTFSLLAVLTWGVETSEVITDNLPSDLRPLVNLCLLAKALLSYPLPFYSAAEILQTCLLRDAAASSYSRDVSRPALLVRGALLMTSYLLALLVPRFSLLMGLTGSVTGAAMTLILPCLFHLRLQWSRLSVGERVIDVGILSLGGICSVAGVICSLKRLVEGL
ncbi:vesicular inhibitory amino acid transporter-like [Centroberyx affinis]|uniref:vesicular inhibitory amino acid transporter-like n=1 Tax=Centroberyx affinis TaxID=166261 RepID=UPI003A5C6A01